MRKRTHLTCYFEEPPLEECQRIYYTCSKQRLFHKTKGFLASRLPFSAEIRWGYSPTILFNLTYVLLSSNSLIISTLYSTAWKRAAVFFLVSRTETSAPFSLWKRRFLTFTGRMLQHLQCSLAPAVGRMLQQLQRSACMSLFSSHHVYLRQEPKQTPLWFPQ